MSDDKKYVTLTTENFAAEVLQARRPVLVDFWAEWCGPCRAVGPAVEQLAAEFEGRATVGKVNVDEQPDLARRYGIRSIPSLLVFRGGQVVDQVIGAQPKSVLAAKLEDAVKAA